MRQIFILFLVIAVNCFGADYYVDPANGNDSLAVTGCVSDNTGGVYTITKAAGFAAYTFHAGDQCQVTAGTGTTPGFYTIASATANALTLTADAGDSGATADVAVTYGNNGSDDIITSGTLNGPKKTIAAAYTACSDGDTINLIAGTYNDTTQGSNWKLGAQAKTYTLKSNVSGTKVTLDFAVDAYIATSITTGDTVTFKDLTFDGSTTSNGIIYTYTDGTTCTNNFVFEDCSFVTNSFDGRLFYFVDAGNVTLDNVSASTAGYCVSIPVGTAVGNVLIKDCSFTSANSAGAVVVFLNAYTDTLGTFTVKNTTITNTDTDGEGIFVYGYNNKQNSVYIEDSTITTAGIGVAIGKEWVTGDTDTTFSSAGWSNATEYAAGSMCKHEGEFYYCHTSQSGAGGDTTEPGTGAAWKSYFEVFRGPETRIIHTTITQTDAGNHSALFGWLKSLYIKDSKASGGNWQWVLKGSNGYTIENSIGVGANCFSIYSTDGAVIKNCTAICSSGYAFIFGNMNDDFDYSYSGICENNIFVANGNGVKVWTDDAQTADSKWLINNNCYYKTGTGVWFSYLNTDRDDLTALKAAWLANSTSFPMNDSGSINVNPNLVLQSDGTYRINNPAVLRLGAGANLPITVNSGTLGDNLNTILGNSK